MSIDITNGRKYTVVRVKAWQMEAIFKRCWDMPDLEEARLKAERRRIRQAKQLEKATLRPRAGWSCREEQ